MKRRKLLSTATLSLGVISLSSISILAKEKNPNKTLKKLITIEEHFILPQISAEVMKFLTQKNGGKSPISEAQRDLMKIVLPTNEFIADLGEKRLQFMDKAGISMQILSYGAGSPQNITEEDFAVSLCQQANDQLIHAIAQHPTRFAGFSLLPMCFPERAVQELERTTRLGLKGVMISGTINGKFLDDAEFFPVFEKAATLNVPIFLHPAIIDREISQKYYQNEQWSAVAGLMFASAGYGWHIDSGISVLRLIFSGLFDKLPNLQIISGHWGEMVPFYLNRLDDQQSKTLSLQHKISDYYKRNIYISPSGFFNENQLIYCLNEIGADRILYAGDYPFLIDENTSNFLSKANISTSDKEKIAFKNAEKLFKI